MPSFVFEQVQDQAAAVLGVPRERLDVGSVLRDLGLDSLMALELVSRLQAAFGLSLPSDLCSGQSTIEAIARFITRRLSGAGGHLGPEHATVSAGARAIAAQIRPRLDALTRAPELQRFIETLPRLDVLSQVYVLRALRRLGWEMVSGQRVAATSLARRLSVSPKQFRLLERMLEMLSEAHLLRRVGDEWEILDSDGPIPDLPAEDLRQTQSDVLQTESALLRRSGERLAELLRGDYDPLQLWLSPEGARLVESVYRDSPPMRVLNALVREAVTTALANAPSGRRMHVLEVGAGTGGTTSCLLPVLDPVRVEYTFTDIGPLFLSRAEQRFRDYRFVRYERLDIETDPVAQGFPRQTHDIVVASHVLHATRSLRSSLRHVRELLVPGGLLVLAELPRPQRWLDLVFGLTAGWWRFEDVDVRPAHPLIPIERWLDVLTPETGFANAAAVPGAHEAERYLSARGALLLAQATS